MSPLLQYPPSGAKSEPLLNSDSSSPNSEIIDCESEFLLARQDFPTLDSIFMHFERCKEVIQSLKQKARVRSKGESKKGSEKGENEQNSVKNGIGFAELPWVCSKNNFVQAFILTSVCQFSVFRGVAWVFGCRREFLLSTIYHTAYFQNFIYFSVAFRTNAESEIWIKVENDVFNQSLLEKLMFNSHPN